jgi:hypothetical protein
MDTDSNLKKRERKDAELHFLVMRVYQSQPIIFQLQKSLEKEALDLFIRYILFS